MTAFGSEIAGRRWTATGPDLDRSLIAACRSAQQAWRARSVRRRIAVLRRARVGLARRAAEIAASIERRPVGETLTSEMLPLLEALRFLERNAVRVLASRRDGSPVPIWLRGLEVELEREPFGVVLIIAPSNYPLMLAGIQAVQALAAGNGVVVKPAPGGRRAIGALAAVLERAGLPAHLFTVADESVRAARTLCRAGPDKVIFTGSSESGRALLPGLQEAATPTTFELSGNDAAFVRRDADLDAVVAVLTFATTLNAGATCVAPRRVFANRELAAELSRRLAAALTRQAAVTVDAATAASVTELLDEAVAQGARLVCGGIEIGPDGRNAKLRPALLDDVRPAMRIHRVEVFAPLLTLTAVDDDEEALRCAAASPYALGATVFGRDLAAARRLAGRVEAGVVVVNDAIVPTAHPAVPLAPRGASGHGVTRGAEGLLAMTRPKAILTARGRRPHLAAAAPSAPLIAAYIEAAYGTGARGRLVAAGRAVRQLIHGGRRS